MSDLPNSTATSGEPEQYKADLVESQREVIISDLPLNLNILNDKVQVTHGEQGAAVIFTGNVRASKEEEGIVGMTLEHFPAMTESLLAEIVDKAISRWTIKKAIIAHRIGYLTVGEPIVFVGTCGHHRKEAFAAAEFIMDYLKNEATFWKKEHYIKNGETLSVWVDSKQTDLDSLSRWE